MISTRENLLDALFHMKVVRIELGLSKIPCFLFLLQTTVDVQC